MQNNEIPLAPGNAYHVYNHANGFENAFENEGNYVFFLKKYAEYISPIAQTFAYALMPNHFHLLIRIKYAEDLWDSFRILKTPKKNKVLLKKHQILSSAFVGSTKQEEYLSQQLSKQFGNFFSAYAQAFNLQQNRKGSLFVSNFKRKPVNDEWYFSRLIHYIHYNPVHHRFAHHPSKWPHSSYSSLISEKPTLLLRNEVLAFFGGITAFVAVHNQGPDIELEW